MPSRKFLPGHRSARRPHPGERRAHPRRSPGRHRGCSPAPAQAPRPNLVFIMADDLGWADLSTGLVNGGYGNDFNETPQLDRLAQEGQSFTQAYASVQCSPTRTALHTGQYATRPDQQRLRGEPGHGSADRPSARGDAGSPGRGRPDRHPGGRHHPRRDPAERRLRDRLLGQVPRHRVGGRDRQQPRLRRELGRQPDLERDLLLRDEQPVQRLGLAEPGPVRPGLHAGVRRREHRAVQQRGHRRRSSTPSSAPTSTSPTPRPTRRSTSSTAARTSRSSPSSASSPRTSRSTTPRLAPTCSPSTTRSRRARTPPSRRTVR